MIRHALVTLLFCVLLWEIQNTGVMAVGKHYCKTECFTMTPLAVQRRDACKIVYRVNSRCHLPHPILDGSHRIGEPQVELRLEQSCLTRHSSYCSNYQLNFMVNVLTANKIYMIIYGWGIDGKQRCSEITYEGRLGAAHSVLHVQCFKLPEGSYNVTVLEQEGLNEGEESLTVVIEDTPLLLGHSYGDKKLRRVKHDLPPGIDITGSTQRAVIPNLFDCKECMNLEHQYHPQSAILHFNYTVMDTGGCQGNCSEFTLSLFKYTGENDQQNCEARNFTSEMIRWLFLSTAERNISSGPVSYKNIDTGCYTFRLKPLSGTYPIYDGFYWFKSAINITNMNDWNTTFFLNPKHRLKSLEIRWTVDYPFNFSAYGLQLWHHHNSSINCIGKHPRKLPVTIIPKRKILLHQTHYTFTNLSIGWYCARLTPMDDRCPPDGCDPRSSHAKKLMDITDEEEPEPEVSNMISPTLIGLLVTGIVLGIALACYLQRHKTVQELFHISYSRVFMGIQLSEIQLVLLVWTRVGPGGEHLDPIMKAFREILTSYAHCKIYDYLDISSLPEDQQYQLFLNNTAWVDHILSHHNIKIVLVGTEGARSSQVLSTSLCRASETLVQNDKLASVDPLDITLFPYILRQLQDRPGLASNYSRIFHVRFADITGEEGELDGVVTWARYKIPQHIRQLTLHLHGLTEEMAVNFSSPSAEMLRSLSEALAAYPGTKSSDSSGSSSASNKLNGVSTSNSTKEPMSEVELPLLEVKRDEVVEKSELAEECSSITSDTSSPGMQVT